MNYTAFMNNLSVNYVVRIKENEKSRMKATNKEGGSNELTMTSHSSV